MSEDAERPRDARELCAYLVRGLVDAPDQVAVREEEREDAVVLVVTVAPDDRGKVIGKGGRIVRALRTVVRAGSVAQRPQDDGRDRGVAAWPIRGAPRACGSARSGGRTACTAPSTSAGRAAGGTSRPAPTLLVDGERAARRDAGRRRRAARSCTWRASTTGTPPRRSAGAALELPRRGACRSRRRTAGSASTSSAARCSPGERRLGRVAAVEDGVAHDMLVLDDEAGTRIPFVGELVPGVDVPGRRLEVVEWLGEAADGRESALGVDVFTLFPSWFSLARGGAPRAERARRPAAPRVPQPARPLAAAPPHGRRRAVRRRRRDADAGRLRGGGAGGRVRRAAGRAARASGASSCSTPAAAPFDDAVAREYAAGPDLVLLAGRYEGFDHRVHDHVATEALSLGPVRAQRRRGRGDGGRRRRGPLPGGLARRRRVQRGGVVLAGAGRPRGVPALHAAAELPGLGGARRCCSRATTGASPRGAASRPRSAPDGCVRRDAPRTDGRLRTSLVRFAAG